MFTYLERLAGFRYLSLAEDVKIKFTKFEFGVLSNYEADKLYGNFYPVEPGDFKAEFTGLASDMSQDLIQNDRLVLKMFVPPEFQYFKVNCILLYAIFGNDPVTVPLFVCYSDKTNPKFSTETNKFGTKLYFMLQIKVPNIEVFDLSNLPKESLEIPTFDRETDIPRVVHNERTQFILNSHQLLTAENKVLVIESEGQHFGLPVRPITLGESGDVIIPSRSDG